jgi:hypothetical protein
MTRSTSREYLAQPPMTCRLPPRDGLHRVEGIGGLGRATTEDYGCQGHRYSRSRPPTMKLVARVGNGTGFLPSASYSEGDEIKIEQGD